MRSIFGSAKNINPIARNFFVALLLQLIFHSSPGQEALIHSYSVNEGLSQSTVTSIFEDNTGYLWIGTGHGLNRFNGYGFTQFMRSQKNGSISNDVIRGMCEDSATGNFFIGTENGLNLTTDRQNFSTPNSSRFNSSISIPLFQKGNELFCLVNTSGLLKYDLKTNHTEVLMADTFAFAHCISDDESRILFSNIHSDINVFDVETGKGFQLSFPELHELGISAILHEEEESFFVISRTRFFRLNIRNRTMEEVVVSAIQLNENMVISQATFDRDNHLWVAVRGSGLYMLDEKFELIKKFDSNSVLSGSTTFDEFSIQQLFADSKGNMWAGTDGYGVACIATQNLRFGNVSMPSKKGSANSYVWGFVKDEQARTWVSTTDRIQVFDKNFNVIHQFPGIEKSGMRFGPLVMLNENTVAAGSNGKVFLIDADDFSVKEIPIPLSNSQDMTHVLATDGLGGLYIGTSFGFHVYDENGLGRILAPNARVTMFYHNPDNKIFASLGNIGLFVVNESGISDTLILYDEMPEQQRFQRMRCLLRDEAGNYWAGTTSGLYHFNSQFEVLDIFDKSTGLNDSYIYAIENGNDRRLWMSTNQGLSAIHPETFDIENFNEQFGLQSNEFNSGSSYRDEEGELFFGGLSGFNHFNPSRMNVVSNPPSLVIENFAVNDSIFYFTANKTFDLQLASNRNNFTFELVCLDFTNPELNNYAYMLEGYDEAFFEAGANRFVRYGSLPPGTYRFIAKSCNGQGKWSEPVLLFSVTVDKFWYQQNGFLALFILAGIGFSGLIAAQIMRARFREKVKQLRQEKEIETMRNNISRDIHDELGAGLTRIALISDSIRLPKGKEDIDSKLETLGNAARNLTSNLKEVIWSTNSRYDSLEELLLHIRGHAADFFEDTPLTLSFDFPKEIPAWKIDPAQRRNLFLICKEALNNVAKHAQATHVVMNFKLLSDGFQFNIIDNGTGMPLNFGSRLSTGITGMKKRAAECGWTLEWRKNDENGTIVKLNGKLRVI